MRDKHQLQITEDLNSILTQEGLSDLFARAGASPAQALFDVDMFLNCMSEGGPGVYRCGGNALWASIATGPVAPNKNKLAELIKWQFSRPQTVFPETIVIGVLPPGGAGGPTPTDVNARGSLVRLTPEEPLHAWITVAAKSVREGDYPVADWVQMVLAAPLEFKLLSDRSAIFWEQVSERESLGKRFQIMFRTPTGRILEIVAFAEQESARLGKVLSRQDIADAWEEHFQNSALSEPVTFNMVDSAMKVHAGILRNPAAAAIAFQCEGPVEFPAGNPWTVYKLVEVVRKATIANAVDPQKTVELLQGVNFRVKQGWIEPGETR